MSTISERMARRDEDDIVEIGRIVESALKGQFGTLLKALIEGQKDECLAEAKVKVSIPAERTLGMVMSLNELQERLDLCIEDRRSVIEERASKAQEKTGSEV